MRIDQAEAVAQSMLDALRDVPGVRRIEVCGSLRRRKETVKDIDLLVSADDAGPIMDRFVGLPGVAQVLGHGDTKSSVTVAAGSDGHRFVIQADLRVVNEEQFPFALALLHRQQGPQHRAAPPGAGARPQAQRI